MSYCTRIGVCSLVLLFMGAGAVRKSGSRVDVDVDVDEVESRLDELENSTLSGCAKFLIVGDYGTKDGDQRDVAAGMAKVASQMNPTAIFGLGDHIYPDGAEGSTSRIAEKWRDLYHRHSSLKRPWYAIAGNHDWYSDAKVERDFTKSSKNTGNYWQMPGFWFKKSFSPSIDVFFIDTMIWQKSSRVARYHSVSSLYSQQKSWLQSQLAGSSASWKIVVGHHPVYSNGNHGITKDILNEVDPLMRQHGAQMYMAGHDHSSQLIQYDKFNYIVTGAGGADARSTSGETGPGSMKWYYGKHSFMSLEICDGSSATLKLYQKNGDVYKSTTLPNEVPGSGGGGGGGTRRRRRRRDDGGGGGGDSRRRRRRRDSRGVDEMKEFGFKVSENHIECGGVRMLDVDQTCSMDETGCTVSPDDSPSRSCGEFCSSNGLECVGGWAQDHEDCVPTEDLGCQGTKPDSIHNLICKCKPMEV